MEYKQNHYIDSDLYSMIKKITDCNELCTICNADETKSGKRWLRYKLSCGCIYHSKCIRKLCFDKMIIYCPKCGYIKPIYKNKYCSNCDAFGHPTISCKDKNIEKNTIIKVSQIIEGVFFEEMNLI